MNIQCTESHEFRQRPACSPAKVREGHGFGSETALAGEARRRRPKARMTVEERRFSAA